MTFYGISEEVSSGILYIVEEFCEGGDLLTFLEKSPEKVTPTCFTRLGTELLGGVKYMHGQSVADYALSNQSATADSPQPHPLIPSNYEPMMSFRIYDQTAGSPTATSNRRTCC